MKLIFGVYLCCLLAAVVIWLIGLMFGGTQQWTMGMGSATFIVSGYVFFRSNWLENPHDVGTMLLITSSIHGILCGICAFIYLLITDPKTQFSHLFGTIFIAFIWSMIFDMVSICICQEETTRNTEVEQKTIVKVIILDKNEV